MQLHSEVQSTLTLVKTLVLSQLCVQRKLLLEVLLSTTLYITQKNPTLYVYQAPLSYRGLESTAPCLNFSICLNDLRQRDNSSSSKSQTLSQSKNPYNRFFNYKWKVSIWNTRSNKKPKNSLKQPSLEKNLVLKNHSSEASKWLSFFSVKKTRLKFMSLIINTKAPSSTINTHQAHSFCKTGLSIQPEIMQQLLLLF